MNEHLKVGRYYQFVGRVREWLGNAVGNDIEVDLGRRDQLVGRIAEHCHVPLEEAEALATEAAGHAFRLVEESERHLAKLSR